MLPSKKSSTVNDSSSRGRRRHRRPRAFTLIELLVVIAIIALLISIIVPTLSKVKRLAYKIICLSNMRQMGISLVMYQSDHDEKLPPSSCRLDDPNQFWLCLLNEQIAEQLIFRCPADRSENFLDFERLGPASELGDYRWSSFATNGYFDNPKYTSYTNILKVPEPDRCVFICELLSDPTMNGVDHVHPDMWHHAEQLKTQVAWDRHDGKSNYLFVDGHAETLDWKETFDFPTVNLWNPQTAPRWPPGR